MEMVYYPPGKYFSTNLEFYNQFFDFLCTIFDSFRTCIPREHYFTRWNRNVGGYIIYNGHYFELLQTQEGLKLN